MINNRHDDLDQEQKQNQKETQTIYDFPPVEASHSNSNDSQDTFHSNLIDWVNVQIIDETTKDELLKKITDHQMQELLASDQFSDGDQAKAKSREDLEQLILLAHPIHQDPFYIDLIKIVNTFKDKDNQKKQLAEIEDHKVQEIENDNQKKDKTRERETLKEKIWKQHPIHQDSFYTNLIKLISLFKDKNKEEELLKKVDEHKFSEIQDSNQSKDKKKERELLKNKTWGTHPIHQDPFYLRQIKFVKKFKNKNKQKELLDKIETQKCAELEKQNQSKSKKRIRKTLRHLIQESMREDLDSYIKEIINTISDPEQKKNASEKIQRAKNKETLVTKLNFARTEKEKALVTEIRKNLEKELSATFLVIREKLVLNEKETPEAEAKAQIKQTIEAIDWHQWSQSESAATTNKPDGSAYSNYEKIVENTLNKKNQNRDFADCSLPPEILDLFQDDIEKLNQFSIDDNDIPILTDICLGKLTLKESSVKHFNLFNLIHQILKKSEVVSEIILNQPSFEIFIQELKKQASPIKNLPQKIQGLILFGIDNILTQNRNVATVLTKTFEARIKPKTSLLFGSHVQAENTPRTRAQQKKPRLNNIIQNPALNNWDPNQNSILALLGKILPQVRDDISCGNFNIKNPLQAIKRKYDAQLKKRNPISKFLQNAFEFLSGIFTRNIGEYDNLIFQEKIANLFQSYYENKTSLSVLKEAIDVIYNDYQSSFFKPVEFDSFMQIRTLVHQAADIETRNSTHTSTQKVAANTNSQADFRKDTAHGAIRKETPSAGHESDDNSSNIRSILGSEAPDNFKSPSDSEESSAEEENSDNEENSNNQENPETSFIKNNNAPVRKIADTENQNIITRPVSP